MIIHVIKFNKVTLGICLEQIKVFVSFNFSFGAFDMKFIADIHNKPSNPYILRY